MTGRLRIGLTVLSLLLFIRLVEPIQNTVRWWRGLRDDARAARAEAEELRRIAPVVAARLRAAERLFAKHSDDFLRDLDDRRPQDALALMTAVAADDAGLFIESVSPVIRTDESGGRGHSSLGVVIEGAGSVESIGWWLATLEAGSPRLGVERLELSGLGQNNERVRVRTTVVGLAALDGDSTASNGERP